MNYSDIWKEHAKLREGVVLKVYLDSLGKPTAGIGHLLTAAEKKLYDVDDKVTQEQVDRWFEADTRTATAAALEQAAEIGIKENWFIAALISVNFQLGTGWKNEFFTTYPAIVAGNFSLAIENLRASKWYRQTPVRVEDFIGALRRAKELKSRPLPKTRTMVGSGVAGAGLIASEAVAEVTQQIEPLAGYSDTLQTLFVVLALVGIGFTIYARIDDRKKGHR